MKELLFDSLCTFIIITPNIPIYDHGIIKCTITFSWFNDTVIENNTNDDNKILKC